MLISVKSLRKIWAVTPDGVLHVGAHEAEELDSYTSNGWLPITWVEAQSSKIQFLEKRLPQKDNHLIKGAVWDKSGEKLTLKITNNTESTSLLELQSHKTHHPEIQVERIEEVTTVALDDLELPTSINYLSLDIQGSELRALSGFQNGIKKINWVYTEVNREPLYEGCAIVNEIDDLLRKSGFNRELTVWTKYGWGDALYVRRGHLSKFRKVFGKFWIQFFYLKNNYFGVKHEIKMKLLNSFFKGS